jgi:hypothetical protein
MRTGKLSISRGHQLPSEEGEPAPRLAVVPAPTARADNPAGDRAPAPVPDAAPDELLPDHELIDRRLTALERLARLAEYGALSAEEFADEKALILGRFGERPAAGATPVSFAPAAPRRSRSLLGRLFGGWRAIPVGLTAGIALSFATQPEATLRVADELLRLFGF